MSVFKVPEISCGHCERAILEALTRDHPQVKASVDLKNKTVTVENLSDEKVESLLKEIGHLPFKLK
jgi:copper chaperone